jgi:murein DD-endopeptidase MepM/ murein hydrolase activator NlpD
VLEIRGTDKEGLVSSVKLTYTATSKPPGVLLNLTKTSSPAPFDPLNGIYLYCYDPENQMEFCEIKIDGNVIASYPNLKNNPSGGVDFYTLPENLTHLIYKEAGSHTIEVIARDKDNQNASKKVEFVVATAERTYPTRNLSVADQKLIWPVNCEPGINCSMGYPDIDGNGVSTCGYTYATHEGTDIGFTWEQMDAGVDVYAAYDGVVKWVFDGKYDRCTSFGDNIVITNPDCAPPTGEITAGSSSGYQVCTESGPYCNADQRINKGWTECIWCFWGANVVVIQHPNNPYVFATRYDHFKTNSITVRPGDTVKRGQKIGQVGSAGRSSGPHLHFEVWTDWYTPVDPWTPGCNPPWSYWQYSP